MHYRSGAVLLLGASILPLTAAAAQTTESSAASSTEAPSSNEALSAELARARAEIDAQRRTLEAQEARLRSLEARMEGASRGSANPPVSDTPETRVATDAPPANRDVAAAPAGVEQVGEGPAQIEMPTVAVLGDMGSVVTRAGQITAETSFEYARADRNRALFRGIEIVEAVLIGVFDINESRQDVLTATAGLRYGITDRFEVGVRVPFVHRSDKSILTPVQEAGNPSRTIDSSTNADGIGDLEFSARYQLLSARGGLPFIIANVGVVAPTGSDPFKVPRDAEGRALKAATGAGFWGLSSSLTAILPSDPAVLFGTLGYSYNFGENVNTVIAPVIIERVEPGQALSASLGIGVSLNQRTSFNLGYAHSWVFGTQTTTRPLTPTPANMGPTTSTSRDLQIGRLLFGVTYRLNNRANLNWSVEIGATEDATDVRTVLRIPIVL